jgi:hypothetical protein
MNLPGGGDETACRCAIEVLRLNIDSHARSATQRHLRRASDTGKAFTKRSLILMVSWFSGGAGTRGSLSDTHHPPQPKILFSHSGAYPSCTPDTCLFFWTLATVTA